VLKTPLNFFYSNVTGGGLFPAGSEAGHSFLFRSEIKNLKIYSLLQVQAMVLK
jgi:hypothetical protein